MRCYAHARPSPSACQVKTTSLTGLARVGWAEVHEAHRSRPMGLLTSAHPTRANAALTGAHNQQAQRRCLCVRLKRLFGPLLPGQPMCIIPQPQATLQDDARRSSGAFVPHPRDRAGLAPTALGCGSKSTKGCCELCLREPALQTHTNYTRLRLHLRAFTSARLDFSYAVLRKSSATHHARPPIWLTPFQ